MIMLLFLVMLVGGILFLVGGLFFTRLTWRADVQPFGRRNSYLQIAFHPERFARPDRLAEIRFLNLIGGVLLCGAVLMLGLGLVSALP